MTAEPGDALAVALGLVLGGSVGELTLLTGGASRETWSGVVVDGTGGRRRFVLQRQTTSARTQAAPLGMAEEADLVRAAARAGVVTAAVIAASGDAGLPAGIDVLGPAWMVTEHVDGETIARRILRDDPWHQARARLLGQAAAALAAVHRIPPADVTLPNVDDPLGRYREALDALGEPHPAFELGLRWLDQHRPAPVAPTVVHGDFRLGNWIVGPDGLRAVIDWELAHVGDPGEDLGWLCVRAWRFGGSGPAAGLGLREDLLDAYRAAGGAALSLDALRWWEAYGTLAWGVMCIAQAERNHGRTSPSVEWAAIGRRACENEHDLLALLPGPPPTPAGDSGDARSFPSEPHDRPTAPELLAAVRAFLADEVLGATAGAVHFHTRVAINVVDQVARQFTWGAGQADAHRRRLDDLGFADDAALAQAIRSGEIDDRFDRVKASVWATVLDKLAVAHPGYPSST